MACSWVDKLEVVSETVLVRTEVVAEEMIVSLLGSSDDSFDNFDCDDGIFLLALFVVVGIASLSVVDSTAG